MRRLLAIVLSVGILCASAFLYAATSGRAEKAVSAPGSATAVRVTGMRAAGIVIEITDTALKIERKVKDKVETMEFTLEKPLVKIKAGDKVRVSYITREDLNVATRVEADVPQTAIKKAKNPEVKTAPAVTAPAGK
jgi:hypothetical protein